MQYIVTTYSRRVFDNDVDAPQIVGMHPGASENQPYPFFSDGRMHRGASLHAYGSTPIYIRPPRGEAGRPGAK